MKLFLKGAKDGIPIALGYLSVSLAFGILAVNSGQPWWAPVVTSLSNFTGTGQFVGIDLIAVNASLTEICFTLLVINLRYLLMSLSLSQRVRPEMKLVPRMAIAFGITDEVFAVSLEQEAPLSGRYLAGLILSSYAGWVGGTIIGVLAGSVIPESVRTAMGIALYAMFIAIIIPPSRESLPVRLTVVIAVVISCGLYVLFPKLGSGWSMIIAGVAAAAVMSVLKPVKTEEAENEH